MRLLTLTTLVFSLLALSGSGFTTLKIPSQKPNCDPSFTFVNNTSGTTISWAGVSSWYNGNYVDDNSPAVSPGNSSGPFSVQSSTGDYLIEMSFPTQHPTLRIKIYDASNNLITCTTYNKFTTGQYAFTLSNPGCQNYTIVMEIGAC